MVTGGCSTSLFDFPGWQLFYGHYVYIVFRNDSPLFVRRGHCMESLSMRIIVAYDWQLSES